MLRLLDQYQGQVVGGLGGKKVGILVVRRIGFDDRGTPAPRGQAWRKCIYRRVATLAPAEQNRVLHRTIKAVAEDVDRMAFNTAIARMMEFTNFFLKQDPRPKAAMEPFVCLLSPFAPHIGEELWRALGHEDTLAYEAWPAYDESLIKEETIEVPVQINGKLRGRVQIPADADRDAQEAAARANPKIAGLLKGKTIVKTIVVPGRMVNYVVK